MPGGVGRTSIGCATGMVFDDSAAVSPFFSENDVAMGNVSSSAIATAATCAVTDTSL